MGDRGGDLTQRLYLYTLVGRGGAESGKRDEFWAYCGKLQNHGGVEVMFCCQDICAP